jgi:hypothetical protein
MGRSTLICGVVSCELSSTAHYIRNHSNRKMPPRHREVRLRRRWSLLVLVSIPGETVNIQAACDELRKEQLKETKTYGLLSSDILGVGGHGLRSLELLLYDGRHLLIRLVLRTLSPL